MKKILTSGLCVVFVLIVSAGCGKNTGNAVELTSISPGGQSNMAIDLSYKPVFDSEDLDSSWSEENATQILLSDEGSKIEGEGAVALEGGIKISKGGIYVVSGKLTDGRIIADVERGEELKIVLKGVDMSSSISAPLYISNGDATIILAENTENRLIDGNTYQYADNAVKEPNACIYGDDNLTITGKGKLMVNANFNNGIGTKDELRIASGDIVVYAANNALKGNDCVLIQNADIHIESKGDGIKSDEDVLEGHGVISIMNSNIEIIAEDDGIQAVNAISIEGGQCIVSAKGKKVKCDGIINIAEGVLQ